jgi:hypothetical protein
MLPELLTPERAAEWETQAAAKAAEKLAAQRALFAALFAAVAFLVFAAGAIAERYHWLPAPPPRLATTTAPAIAYAP